VDCCNISLTMVSPFFFDLRINYYLLLIYDPNKHIGLIQEDISIIGPICNLSLPLYY
jgi:hypothetical protein